MGLEADMQWGCMCCGWLCVGGALWRQARAGVAGRVAVTTTHRETRPHASLQPVPRRSHVLPSPPPHSEPLFAPPSPHQCRSPL